MNRDSFRQEAVNLSSIEEFEFLGAVEPFSVFPERWLALMLGLMRVETFAEGELVFRAGDSSDSIYVVREGEVALFTDTVGEPVQLVARIKTGDLFGEVGVLERSRRTVSARATKQTCLLRLEASDLTRLGRASRRFGVRLAQSALLRYLRDSANRIERGARGEVRIRVARQVLLRQATRAPISLLLDNLSFGGACLRDVPADWTPDEAEPISLSSEEGSDLLQFSAKVAWRSGSSVGLAFCDLAPGHDARVDAALDVLLAESDANCHERAL